jgi:hypothetical protein
MLLVMFIGCFHCLVSYPTRHVSLKYLFNGDGRFATGTHRKFADLLITIRPLITAFLFKATGNSRRGVLGD